MKGRRDEGQENERTRRTKGRRDVKIVRGRSQRDDEEMRGGENGKSPVPSFRRILPALSCRDTLLITLLQTNELHSQPYLVNSRTLQDYIK
jgi:hypothetical protein